MRESFTSRASSEAPMQRSSRSTSQAVSTEKSPICAKTEYISRRESSARPSSRKSAAESTSSSQSSRHGRLRRRMSSSPSAGRRQMST